MKTVYITEEQKKKLKKAIAAQDQVGGKVNAGVMDAVVGGMCEDVEDDKFVLGVEMDAPIGGVYYHIKEGKINESPDYVDFFDVKWRTGNSYPFMYLLSTQKFYIGNQYETHMQMIGRCAPELFKEIEYDGFSLEYEKEFDTMLTGRYWQDYNVISFWKTPIDKRMNVRKVVDALKEQGIIQSSEYTVLDYWDNNTMSNCVFPIKWLFNGTYDMFAGRCSRIAPMKSTEYCQTGKYSYFQVFTNGSGIQCVNVSGNEILTVMEYYMQSSISEGRKKVVKNDKGEIVPEKCDKCGGKVVLQIHGEPVYVCKDCGKYFGTMPFTLKENRDYSKWLEQLKQRRDPDNIEENVETEISPEDVDLSSFNIKRRLNPKFWVDGHLDSRIRLKLMDISDDFIEYLGIDPHIVKDVLMTGSLANFNWCEEFSDIDLHVLLDYSDVDENTEFVKQYFMSQKNSWNNEHGDIKIFGFPVEVYVQDVNEKHDSSGVYSLDKDKWLVEPDRDVLATSKVNKAFIKDKVSDYTNKIDKLIYLYEKAKDDEYKLGKIAEKANVLWDEIKNSRKKGFEISNGKEINNFNIIFKTLRRFDYLDKLYQLKTKTYNKLNSIE